MYMVNCLEDEVTEEDQVQFHTDHLIYRQLHQQIQEHEICWGRMGALLLLFRSHGKQTPRRIYVNWQ